MRSGDFTDSIGYQMVRIAPGRFQMGSPADDGEEKEHPQHPVQITRAFMLGAREVTLAQYHRVMDNSSGDIPDSDQPPVNYVSWLDAVIFCNKLSLKDNRVPYYRVEGEGDSARVTIIRADGPGYRLPTEAEWEYACRAGSETRFPFGQDASVLDQHAWCNANSEQQTHPVGTKRRERVGPVRHAGKRLGMVPGRLRRLVLSTLAHV